MALFAKKSSTMDVIRCDEPSYLIRKWRPNGAALGSSRRENAIRWGSSLRVKDGSVAVLVYTRPDGFVYDYIEGPADMILETANLPVLASLIGRLYDGGSPFQAEVYRSASACPFSMCSTPALWISACPRRSGGPSASKSRTIRNLSGSTDWTTLI